MKQIALLTIIAGLSVVSMATIYASDLGQTSMVVAAPTSQGIGMLGHIEFELVDKYDNLKAYYQTDNFITDIGAACVAAKIFDASETVAPCPVAGTSVSEFKHIRLGNASAGPTDQTRTDIDDGGNDMVGFRTDAVVEFSQSGQTADDGITVVTVETDSPFLFFENGAAGTNTTANIFEAGLFDATSGGNSFAIQNTTTGLANPGIDVNDGDQLTVTWTITVGSDS